jgi:hypothetical protein
MSAPLVFYGCSDDTFGEYGRTDTSHDNCASLDAIVLKVSHGPDVLFVVGQYGINNLTACWMIGVMPGAEYGPLSPWPMRFVPKHGFSPTYSPVLIVDAPDGATVEVVL